MTRFPGLHRYMAMHDIHAPLLSYPGLPSGYTFGADRRVGGVDGFLLLKRNNFDPDLHYSEGDGWKLHISIKEQDLPRAWDDVIAPILLEAGVDAAKFADGKTLTNLSDKRSKQAGKIVAVYTPGNASWHELTRKLEIGLAEAGIRSGQKINGDLMIPGSRYLGRRNERRSLAEGGGVYIGSEEIREMIESGELHAEAAVHNPFYRHDPMIGINFKNNATVRAAHATLDKLSPTDHLLLNMAGSKPKATGNDVMHVPEAPHLLDAHVGADQTIRYTPRQGEAATRLADSTIRLRQAETVKSAPKAPPLVVPEEADATIRYQSRDHRPKPILADDSTIRFSRDEIRTSGTSCATHLPLPPEEDSTIHMARKTDSPAPEATAGIAQHIEPTASTAAIPSDVAPITAAADVISDVLSASSHETLPPLATDAVVAASAPEPDGEQAHAAETVAEAEAVPLPPHDAVAPSENLDPAPLPEATSVDVAGTADAPAAAPEAPAHEARPSPEPVVAESAETPHVAESAAKAEQGLFSKYSRLIMDAEGRKLHPGKAAGWAVAGGLTAAGVYALTHREKHAARQADSEAVHPPGLG